MNGVDSTIGMNNNKMSTMNELVILRQFDQMVREIVADYLENQSKSGNNNNRKQGKQGRRNAPTRFL